MADFNAADLPSWIAELGSGQESFTSTLQAIIDLARDAIDGCTRGGITLLDRTGPSTAVATDPLAARVDAIQYAVNAGPCLDAYRRQVFNRVDDTESDDRWPQFCRGAFEAGVHSILSYPLIVAGDGLGAMNVYGEAPFSVAAERTGVAFAAHASLTLVNARAFWRADELRQNLEFALETRGVIDQAKGILIAQQGIGADEAFEIIRRASQRENRKVFDIARDIVGRTGAASNDGPLLF